MTGIIQSQEHKLLTTNGVADHVPILVGMRLSMSVSDLLQHIKRGSSKWIDDKGFLQQKFEWPSGFGAFSHGASQVKDVIRYIENQEQHHLQVSFRRKYLSFLPKFKVEYDERYIFRELV